MGLTIWATKGGVPVSPGPISSVISAQTVLGEIDQFSKSSLVLDASDQRAIDALPEYTLLEVVQDGVGTIAFGYVLNPRQQITDTDAHTITIDLEPRTMEMVWGPRTHRGWQVQGWLGDAFTRLVTLTPGWSCNYTGLPGDIQTIVTLNDTTPLAAVLATAKQFDCYVRQGRDGAGTPLRTIEVGQFGAAPTVWLTSANGGNADAMGKNGMIRLAATVERQPNDVTSLVNVVTPFGGGNTTDSLVTLERLWRIVNDPGYVNAGKYGNVPGSVFPQYDPNYPISDPGNPPTGLIQRDASGNLLQGAFNTRFATLDGHWDYMVYDAASYAQYGYRGGSFIDSGLTYTDSSVANQELTEIALYLETIANFKHFAHPHHTFTATTIGTGIPTAAGDLIAVDFQRSSTNANGAVVEMNVTENLRVMSVTRNFPAAGAGAEPPPVDTYVLSNLGRFDQTDATGAATTATNLVALQIQQGTSVAPVFFGPYVGNADATHPIDIPVRIPDELFRWHRCSLRVDFFPYRATANTAVNQTGTHIISVGGAYIELPTPTDINLSGTFNAAGTGAPGTTDGFDFVQTGVENDAAVQLHLDGYAGTHTGTGPDPSVVHVITVNGEARLASYSNGPVNGTDANLRAKINFTKAKTQSAFTAPIAKLVKAAQSVIAHIPAGQPLADLPQHTHPLDQRIPDAGQPSGVNVTLAINGQALTSGAKLTSGTRNGDGTFSSSFELADIGPFIELPGQTIMISIRPGTNSGNPYGVGYFAAGGTFFGEWGSIKSIARVT